MKKFSMHMGIILSPKAVLYEQIGKNAADELLSGWIVAITKEQEGWYYITTHYGYQGWLPKQNVCEIPYQSFLSRLHSSELFVICRPFTDVMKQPRVQAEILETLFMGSLVTRDTSAANIDKAFTGKYEVPDSSAVNIDKAFTGKYEVPDSSAVNVDKTFTNNCKQPASQMPPSTLASAEPANGYLPIQTAAGIHGFVPAIALTRRKEDDSFFLSGRISTKLSHFPEDIHRLRMDILHYAQSYLGTQYRWGGKTPEGIDCSGLTFMSYYMCGILIYRDAAIRKGFPVHEIPYSVIQPADLLYFPGHIAIYLGCGKYIHCTGNPKSFGCVINSLYPNDPDYRADLAESLTAVGSVF